MMQADAERKKAKELRMENAQKSQPQITQPKMKNSTTKAKVEAKATMETKAKREATTLREIVKAKHQGKAQKQNS